MPVTRFLTTKELSKILNYSEKEIDDLVLKRQIPHHIKPGGMILFPMEEVLARFKPRKKSPPRTKPKKKPEVKTVIEPKKSATPEKAAEDKGF